MLLLECPSDVVTLESFCQLQPMAAEEFQQSETYRLSRVAKPAGVDQGI
jgi:hypothetical protein